MALKKNEPCPECGRFDNRGLTIDAVVIKDNKVLLIKRGIEPFKGSWGIPGGYVEWGQTVEVTVKRELKEETGLDAAELKLIGVFSKPNRHPKQAINLGYLVKAEGKLKAGDDAVDANWFDINKLPKKIAFDHKEIIERAIPLSSR